MAHGYYNLDGDFVVTASKAEAVDAWRSERGYSTGGVYDMGGGEVIDTRNVSTPSADAQAGVVPDVAQQGPIAPEISGLIERADLSAYNALRGGQGTQQPSYQFDDTGGIQSLRESKLEPTIPGLANNVSQAQGQVTPVQGESQYDVQAIQGGPYLTPQELAVQKVFGDAELPPGSITQGLFGGLINLMSGMGGPTAEQYARMRELQDKGMSVEESREIAMRPGRADLSAYNEPRKQAASYYGPGSTPTTLPTNAQGDVSNPSAMLSLVNQLQMQGDTNLEIAGRLVERFLTGQSDPSATPDNILLFLGDQPNPAYEDIQQTILSVYEQAIQADPYNMELRAQYELFQSAQSIEDFYTILGYGSNDVISPSGNIWTYGAGAINENVADPATVANSILSGQGYYYDTTKNPGVFGGGGGGSARPTASRSWGQAPGGLYLWRIGA